MTVVQHIKGSFAITDPAWPKYEIRRVITSDSFNRAGPLLWSMTDVAYGGTPHQWKPQTIFTNHTEWDLSDGHLASEPGVMGATPTLSDLPADFTAGFTVGESIGNRIIVTFRNQVESGHRLDVAIFSGSVRIEERIEGVTTYLDTQATQVGAGDRVDIGLHGSTMTVAVNGQPTASGEVTLSGTGMFYFREHGADHRSVIDDLVIYE